MLIFFYSWMNNIHINSASNEQNHKHFQKNLTKNSETKLKNRTRPPCYPQETRQLSKIMITNQKNQYDNNSSKKIKNKIRKNFSTLKKIFPGRSDYEAFEPYPATSRVTLRLWSSPGLACKAGGAPDLSGPTFIQLHDSSDRL